LLGARILIMPLILGIFGKNHVHSGIALADPEVVRFLRQILPRPPGLSAFQSLVTCEPAV
jgi:hypothetical protein